MNRNRLIEFRCLQPFTWYCALPSFSSSTLDATKSFKIFALAFVKKIKGARSH